MSGTTVKPCALPAILLLVVTIFAGCDRPVSYGVLLWSADEESSESGAVVSVYSSSQLNGTHTYRTREGETDIVTERWRIELVRRMRDAEQFAETYRPWSHSYGVARIDGLRVRERPDSQAAQMYKLRLGETVKIVSRGTEERRVGTYVGYWYEVLTADGVRGHTFSEYLQVKTLEELDAVEELATADEFLERLFGTVFRPDYYRDMYRNGRYDLARFLPDYGIFADADARTLVISREDHTTTIGFDRITKPTADSYAFEGSTLILTVRSANWVNLIYSDGGKRYSEDFVYFPDDIETLANLELDRRDSLFAELLEHGSILSSSAYGTITLVEDGTFTWEGFERLVPEVISPLATGSGIVRFPLYLDKSAAENYAGALVLEFARDDPTQPTEPLRFVYTYGNGGIRLTLVPDTAVDTNLVQGRMLSSIIIFFTYR